MLRRFVHANLTGIFPPPRAYSAAFLQFLIPVPRNHSCTCGIEPSSSSSGCCMNVWIEPAPHNIRHFKIRPWVMIWLKWVNEYWELWKGWIYEVRQHWLVYSRIKSHLSPQLSRSRTLCAKCLLPATECVVVCRWVWARMNRQGNKQVRWWWCHMRCCCWWRSSA